jgi:hypothetical protein
MKRGSTEVALLVLGLAASGCGGEEEASPPALVTNEVAVFVDDPEATWAGTGGSELSALLSFSVTYWGGSGNALAGWSLHIHHGGGGSTNVESRSMSMGTELGPCVGALPVPHEVGHAMLYLLTGDPDGHHTDPRWKTLPRPGCHKPAVTS